MIILSCSILAFLLSCGLCPLIIKFCNKKGLYDKVDGRKVHSGNISRLGGIAVFVSFFIASLAFDFFGSGGMIFEYWQILIAILIIFVTGLIDDLKDLPARLKFLLQIVAALLVSCSPFYFKSFFGLELPEFLGRTGIFFWLLLCVNAYNLIDGVDWLCSGISLISVLTFAVCGYYKNWSYSSMMFIIIGCIAGFMVWNKPQAKIFLGDCGSTTLGFLIAVIPVLNPSDKTYDFNQILICMLLSAIPTIDVLAAIIRRLREGRGIFSPDRAHLHHKLMNIGFSKTAILVCIFSVQIFIGLMICFSLFTGRKTGTAFIICAYFVVLGLFILVHYVNRSFIRQNKGNLKDCPLQEKFI